MDELQGTARRDIRTKTPISDQTFIGVVQAVGESSGQVETSESEAGGQLFMFTMNPEK